jgi:four helix bundle protein
MAGDSSCHFFSHFGNHAKLLQFVGAVVMPTSENDRRRIPMASRSYQDLVAWQKSMALVTAIYHHTRDFPSSELYGLTSQLRRAAVSIPSNIAEGQGRLSVGEFKQFLGHAKGSSCEVETQLLIARNLGYLDDPSTKRLVEAVREIGRILSGLLSSFEYSRTRQSN